jgi:hypothetical protein
MFSQVSMTSRSFKQLVFQFAKYSREYMYSVLSIIIILGFTFTIPGTGVRETNRNKRFSKTFKILI